MKRRSTFVSRIHEVLRQMPYALYAVGVCGKKEESTAFIASWVTQCSFDPPLIMAAIRLDSTSFDWVKKGKAFSVNLLDRDQGILAKELVRPEHSHPGKLEDVAHKLGKTGAPILAAAYAHLECEVRKIVKPGDHGLVIGEVVSAGTKRRGSSLMASDLRWHYAG